MRATTKIVWVGVLAFLGCAESGYLPYERPAVPPRVEAVIDSIRARTEEAYWMVPELLEESAVAVFPDGQGGAALERIDFAAFGAGRRERGSLGSEEARAFFANLERSGFFEAPPATIREGVRIWYRRAGVENSFRIPRSHPVAEAFRTAAREVLGEVDPDLVQGPVDRGYVSRIESGPLHFEDPAFGDDGEIYAKAGIVYRYDGEARRFVPAFEFPEGADPHRVQWEVPTRTLLALHRAGLRFPEGAGAALESSPGERYAVYARPSPSGSTLIRIDFATGLETPILGHERALASPVIDDEGRWVAYTIQSDAPGEPEDARVLDSTSGVEFDPGEARAEEHRPLAFAPGPHIFYILRQEAGEVEYEVYLWSAERRKVEQIYRYDPAEFRLLAILPDGRALVRKTFVEPITMGAVWRLGVFDFYTSRFASLSLGDGDGPGSFDARRDRFVYEAGGDVFLWRTERPGEPPP